MAWNIIPLLRAHKLTTGLVVLVGGWWGWHALVHSARTPVPAAAPVQSAPLGGVGVHEAFDAKKFVEEQRLTAQLPKQLDALTQTLTALRQDLQGTKQALAQEKELRSQGEQRHAASLEDVRKTAQQAQTMRTAQPPAGPQPAPTHKTEAKATTPAAPVVAGKMVLLEAKKLGDHVTPPPRPNRGEIPYIPVGSIAEVRLVTGGSASSRAGGSIPLLLVLTRQFETPRQLRGPTRPPTPTAAPIQGCLVLGEGAGDLANSRMLGRTLVLSCVFPDGAAFEAPMKGYVTGVDNQYGLPGVVEHHESAAIARAAAIAFVQEAGTLLALTRSRVVIAPGTNNTAPFQGVQTGLQKLTDFYLQQAEFLQASITVKAGIGGRLVLQEPILLDGLPAQTLLAHGAPQGVLSAALATTLLPGGP